MTDAQDALEALTALVPDFPEPGILFRDLTPVFANGDALLAIAEELSDVDVEFDVVAGVEARGFVLAAAVALASGTGVLLIRKAGKLPRPDHQREYALEYGTATLELQAGHLAPGTRVLLVDDVLATGGTLAAASGLCHDAGLEVVGIGVAVELSELGGRTLLGDLPITVLQSV
ncbi:adenine phosphoribosyltransferase [soil metagenome]